MLEASGLRVHLGGNIGIPPLDLLAEDIKEEDWVVLELANYQLIDLKYSIHIAVCLMVEPEHLDWHADVNEYYQAKAKLFEVRLRMIWPHITALTLTLKGLLLPRLVN